MKTEPSQVLNIESELLCCAYAETCFPNIFQSFVLLDMIQKKTWGVCWTCLCGDFWLSVCIGDLKAHLESSRLWCCALRMWCGTLVCSDVLCNRIDQMSTQWYVGVYKPSFTWLRWAKSFNISGPTPGFWYHSNHQWFDYQISSAIEMGQMPVHPHPYCWQTKRFSGW